uniref:Uncharacterized protein n=1 Tax=Timema monikensis TaxID=170555 RepID=A0A7R9EKF6_9NEOP|nr:unnamed protein product [Timema monikensis]
MKHTVKHLKQILLQHKVYTKDPLSPRDAFFGRRTNCIKLFHEEDLYCADNIKYLDVATAGIRSIYKGKVALKQIPMITSGANGAFSTRDLKVRVGKVFPPGLLGRDPDTGPKQFILRDISGQRPYLPHLAVVNDYHGIQKYLTGPFITVDSVINVNDEVIFLNYKEARDALCPKANTSVAVACYTTVMARLHLYSILEQ